MTPPTPKSTFALGVRAALFSLFWTLLFFFPSLRDHSHNAGFMFTGDILGFYWPSTIKLQSLISQFHFNAIDIHSFNGSSDFYVTPNFFGVHPMLVVYSLLARFTKPDGDAVRHAMVVVMAIEAFLACFFSLRLAEKYFRLPFGAAGFVGVFFAFSMGAISGLGEPEYLYTVSMLPWCVYAALEFSEKPSLLRLPGAVFPPVVMILGGYMPIGVATLFLATAMIGYVAATFDEDKPGVARVARALSAYIPLFCAVVVVSPFLLETLRFMKASPSANTASLFYSAQQLAEIPQMILRIFSPTLPIPGPLYEFYLTWGFTAVYVALMFILIPTAGRSLTPWEWRNLIASFSVYAVTGLAIYGAYSPVASMVYYFIPQVGGMHIYQRFLYPATLLSGLAVATMFVGLLRARPEVSVRVGAGLCILITFALSYYVAFHPEAATKAGFTNTTIFELIGLALLACALVTPFDGFKYAALIFLVALQPMNSMYGFSAPTWNIGEIQAKQPVLLDVPTQTTISAYFRARSHKELVKYADLTPLWTASGTETFSKLFPYLVQDKIQLSSYGGFNFYLSPPRDYMQKAPVQDNIVMKPDWTYLRRTGVDFVVALGSQMPALQLAGIVKDIDGPDVLHLPNDVAIAPVMPQPAVAPPAYDDGYFRLDAATPGAATPTGSRLNTNHANRFSINVAAPAGAALTYELWNHPGLHFSVDGKSVQPVNDNGVTKIPLTPGSHRVEVRYKNLTHTAFWVLLFTLMGGWFASGAVQLSRRFRAA